MDHYHLSIFDSVRKYIESQSFQDRAKIRTDIDSLQQQDFEAIATKILRSPVRELIVKNHRLIFFVHDSTIYMIGAFVKKTQKTPVSEIDRAWGIYRQMIMYLTSR